MNLTFISRTKARRQSKHRKIKMPVQTFGTSSRNAAEHRNKWITHLSMKYNSCNCGLVKRSSSNKPFRRYPRSILMTPQTTDSSSHSGSLLIISVCAVFSYVLPGRDFLPTVTWANTTPVSNGLISCYMRTQAFPSLPVMSICLRHWFWSPITHTANFIHPIFHVTCDLNLLKI